MATSAASGKAPRGFDVVASQHSAEVRITDRLEETRQCMEAEGYESSIKVHSYRDGTVDGELSVHIGRGVNATDVSKSLESCFGTENLREIWFSIGVRFGVGSRDLDQAESRYERHKGLHEAWFFWRKMYRNDKRQRRAQIIEPFGRMQTQMIPGIEDVYDRKVQQVILRMHFNPENEKPKR